MMTEASFSQNPVVIGGGISGLCAAYALSKKGASPVLIEPDEPGGVIRSVRQNGFTYELGPNVFLEKPEIKKLCEETGLKEQVRYPVTDRYKQFVWHSGKQELIPKSPAALVKTPLISGMDKLLLPFKLFSGSVLKDMPEDLSAGEFISRLIGEKGVRTMLDPALSGIYGGDIDRLSAKTLFPEMWQTLSRGLSLVSYLKTKKKQGSVAPRAFTIEGGNQVLPQALRDAIRSKGTIKRTKAASLGYDKISRTFSVICPGGEKVKTQSVYLATSGAATAGYLSDLAPELASRLKEITYAPIAVVHCVSSEPQKIPAETFGVLFPSSSESRVLGVMYNSILFPHMSPPGKEVLTVCLGGVKRGELVDLTDEKLTAIVESELKERFDLSKLEFLSICRWRKAIPQYNLGYANILSGMCECEKTFPGLCFIGVDRGGVGVPDRVKMGLNV